LQKLIELIKVAGKSPHRWCCFEKIERMGRRSVLEAISSFFTMFKRKKRLTRGENPEKNWIILQRGSQVN